MVRKRKNIDWSLYDHLLGTMTDVALSKIIVTTPSVVTARRQKLGILPHGRVTPATIDAELLSQGLRICSKCLQQLPVDQFVKSQQGKAKSRQCLPCIQKRHRASRLANKLKAIALLGGKCSACDYQLHPSALQFHHVGSDKDKHISYLLHCSGKSQQLIEELDKCCLLCSNCHDAFHFGDLRLEFEKASLGFNVIRRSNDYV